MSVQKPDSPETETDAETEWTAFDALLVEAIDGARRGDVHTPADVAETLENHAETLRADGFEAYRPGPPGR